jgi:hypothetical protein
MSQHKREHFMRDEDAVRAFSGRAIRQVPGHRNSVCNVLIAIMSGVIFVFVLGARPLEGRNVVDECRTRARRHTELHWPRKCSTFVPIRYVVPPGRPSLRLDIVGQETARRNSTDAFTSHAPAM